MGCGLLGWPRVGIGAEGWSGAEVGRGRRDLVGERAQEHGSYLLTFGTQGPINGSCLLTFGNWGVGWGWWVEFCVRWWG